MCQGANKAYRAAELDGLLVCPDCIWSWTKSLSIRSAVLSDSQQSEVRAIMELGVKQVFDKFADVDRKLLLADRLQDALAEFGSHLPQDEVDVLMSNMDIDSNGGLDLGEFAEALRQISTQEERFTKTLPITGMLASSLAVPGAADPLKELSNLEQDQLELAIEAFILSLRKLLKVVVHGLGMM